MTRCQILVIGSGAGGAVTALEAARAGCDVVVLEEGRRHTIEEYGLPGPEAMRRLYRRGGMTPILGSVPIGYVEGSCVGGSTEINSGFWHRTPPEALARWRTRFGLVDASPADLEPHFAWAEAQVSVRPYHTAWPLSTQVLARGAERMGWAAGEIPRMVTACDCRTPCASGCRTGAKQSMSRTLVPLAEHAGARVVPDCRVTHLITKGRHVTEVRALVRREDGGLDRVAFEADHVFVCCGPMETPALLRRSGVRRQVGCSLTVHPMLKVAARFSQEVYGSGSPLPLLQVHEFFPDLTMGGAFCSPGHLALHLSENWPSLADRMSHLDHIAMFYVAVSGTGVGSVVPGLRNGDTYPRYELSIEDHRNLGLGMARLMVLLLEAGAVEVFPAVYGLPAVTSRPDAEQWMAQPPPKRALSLTTVHAVATCPTGERRDRTAADSYGKVYDCENLYINDASMLPGSPGVNPQGSIMAMARRNVLHFIDTVR